MSKFVFFLALLSSFAGMAQSKKTPKKVAISYAGGYGTMWGFADK